MAEAKNGGEKVSDVYEVTRGKVTDVDGRDLGPGEHFRPTRRQVAKGTLEGKARMVRQDTSVSARGADIGIRALEWGSEIALKKAVKNDVTVEEMEATGGPSGETGYVTADVNAVLEARASGQEEDGSEEEDSGQEDESEEE